MAKRRLQNKIRITGKVNLKGFGTFYQRADPFYYRIGYFHCYHICRSGIDFVFLYGRGGSEQDREYPVVGPGDQSWISRELDGGARGFSCDVLLMNRWFGIFFFPDPVFPRFSRSEANEPEPGIVVETFPV